MMRERINDIISILGWLKRHVCLSSRERKNRITLNTIKEKKLHILMNGPSCSETIGCIASNDDVMMVNSAANSELFWRLKPRYYCIIDPIFWGNDNWNMDKNTRDSVVKLWENLKKVDWELQFFIESKLISDKIDMMPQCVTFIRFNGNGLYCKKFTGFMLRQYKKNNATPIYTNIAIIALYLGIQLRYSNIYLHGLDFDKLANYTINENNDVVLLDKHFYDNGVYENYTEYGYAKRGEFYVFVESFANALRQFSVLRKYADMLGVNIYNYSKYSMIDSFEKKVDIC